MSDLFPSEEGQPPDEAGRPLREPLLGQGDIDALAGYVPDAREPAATPLRAIAEAELRPREPLPMLAVILDQLAVELAGSFRELLGRATAVSVAALWSGRYGDVVDETVLPSQLAVFRCEGWDGSGLVAIGPDFALLVLDALLGAGPGSPAGRLAGRPFSAIEGAILTRIADLVLHGLQTAFGAVVPVVLRRERVETDPRLAAIARPVDLAYVATISLAFDGHAAPVRLVLPAATLEPARAQLRGGVPGVKLGRDAYWSRHLATELWQAHVEAEAVLHETALPLRRVLGLGVGDTLMFDMRPTDPVEVRCGGLAVTRGRIGRAEGRIAIQVTEPTGRPGGAFRDAAA